MGVNVAIVDVAIVDPVRLPDGIPQSGTILRVLVSTTSGVTLWVVLRATTL
jgi:hypothetical protein